MSTTEEPETHRSDAEFKASAEGLRGELLAHCYRMVGSVHDAEDLVQETYLRAWRALDQFERRSSMRTWLYRVATNVCLNALKASKRRPMPMYLWAEADPDDAVSERLDLPWLEPLPGALVGLAPSTPEEAVTTRESVRLAFVAIAQTLPPRQRAALILRDVLRFGAAEVAEILDTTTIAVNSSLQRAREHLARTTPTSPGAATAPLSVEQRRRLDAYVAAWEDKNVPAIVALLTADAVWEMPPLAAWYQGRERIGRHLANRCPVRPGQARLFPVDANGQPAFATYVRDVDGTLRAVFLQVLDLGPHGIEHVYAFLDLGVFELFGLPLVVEVGAAAR